MSSRICLIFHLRIKTNVEYFQQNHLSLAAAQLLCLACLSIITFGMSLEYYNYDLREPKRKIVNPDDIWKESTITTNEDKKLNGVITNHNQDLIQRLKLTFFLVLCRLTFNNIF